MFFQTAGFNSNVLKFFIPSTSPLSKIDWVTSSLPAMVKPNGPLSCFISSTVKTTVLLVSLLLVWLLSLSFALLLGLSVWWPESSPLWITAFVSMLLKLWSVNLALFLWIFDQSSVRSRFRILRVIISSGEFWRILKAVS